MRASLSGLGLLAIPLLAAGSGVAQQPFGVDTTFRTPIATQGVGSLYELPDGKLLVAGDMTFPDLANPKGLARLNSDGSRDPTFEASVLGRSRIKWWMDRFYVSTSGTVRRVLADGTWDSSFIEMNAGPYFSSLQGGDYHLYPDGRVLMCGLHDLQDSIRGFMGLHSLIWFGNQGYLDTTQIHRKCNGTIYSLYQLPDGKFICSGFMTEYDGQPANGVIRIHANGDLDTTFHTEVMGFGWPGEFHLQADGKLICAGFFKWGTIPDTLSIVRLLPNGDLDPTFNNDLQTLYTYDPDEAIAPIAVIRPLDATRFIIGGAFTFVDGEPRGSIAVIDTAGQLVADQFVGAACGPFDYGVSTYATIGDIARASDGSWYIGGSYHGYTDGTVNDTLQRMVTRLYGLDVGVQEEETTTPRIMVYPNPGTDRLKVSWTGTPSASKICLLDATGRAVAVMKASANEMNLDTGQLACGVYTVVVTTPTGRSATKWIKQ